MVNHPWQYHRDTSSHSSYMVLQTPIFNHKIISIGVLNSRFFLYFLRTPLQCLTWACILQFKLFIMLVFLISQPYLCVFQPNLCYYLSYVSSTSYKIYKLKLPHKLTTERALHSRVKLSIAQNVDCCFPKIVESQTKWMYQSSIEIWRKSLDWVFQYFVSNIYFNYYSYNTK